MSAETLAAVEAARAAYRKHDRRFKEGTSTSWVAAEWFKDGYLIGRADERTRYEALVEAARVVSHSTTCLFGTEHGCTCAVREIRAALAVLEGGT